MTQNAQSAQPGRSPCQGVSASGKPCTRTVAEGLTFCHGHDPARAQDRSRWGSNGGRASATDARVIKAVARVTRLDTDVVRPGDLPGVRDLVHRSMTDLLAGKIDAPTAGALANLAKTYQILDAAVKDEELTKELTELKALAEERGAA
ncbi:MAG: hypothetical protein R2853_21090 [Thermomicrobiales bacterium]